MSTPEVLLYQFTLVICAIPVLAAVHILAVRFLKVSVVLGFLIGYVLSLGVLSYLLSAFPLSEFFLGAVTFTCFAYCYFHFINIGESSVRVRILYELKTSSKGYLTGAEIYAAYSAKDILKSRFQRLSRDGHILEKDGTYYLHRSFLLPLAKTFQVLKVIFIGKRSFNHDR
jgi:hypothetical protein